MCCETCLDVVGHHKRSRILQNVSLKARWTTGRWLIMERCTNDQLISERATFQIRPEINHPRSTHDVFLVSSGGGNPCTDQIQHFALYAISLDPTWETRRQRGQKARCHPERCPFRPKNEPNFHTHKRPGDRTAYLPVNCGIRILM